MILNINTTALEKHVETLTRISRSALPVAVRQTLNKAAFDVKTNTMPQETNRFEKRKPTFFKANSRVNMAKGFEINSMQSIVGFVPKTNDPSHSVEDLDAQEHGGQIGNRSFVPLAAARTNKSWSRMVKAGFRMSKIRNSIVDARKAAGKNKAEQFIKSAVLAGKGGFVIGTNQKKGNRLLLYVNSVKRVGKNTVVNATAMYSVKGGRKVKPNQRYHHFMQAASLTSAAKMRADFVIIAEKKINSIK